MGRDVPPRLRQCPKKSPHTTVGLVSLPHRPRMIRCDVYIFLGIARPACREGWIHCRLRLARQRCERAGVVGLRFHDLRHEAASRLVGLGLSTIEVSAVTGHKSMQMLKRYTQLRATDLATRIAALTALRAHDE